MFSFFQGGGGVDYPHFRFNFKKKIGRGIGNSFWYRPTDTDYPFLSGCYIESCTGFRLFPKESKTHPIFPPIPLLFYFFAAYLK